MSSSNKEGETGNKKSKAAILFLNKAAITVLF